MNTPKISVIVPIYNMEKYLSRCLDSILSNDYGNLEIICVDDGSTDSSANILKDYQRNDSRIICILQENKGISAARNAGKDVATGQFISFVDSDDWVSPCYFSRLYSLLQMEQADIAICGHIRTGENVDFKTMTLGRFPIEVYRNHQFLGQHKTKSYVWGKLYAAKVIQALRFDVNEKVEDAVFNSEIALQNESLKVVYCGEPLYAYYQRSGSLVTMLNRRDVLSLSKKQLDYASMAKNRGNHPLYNIFVEDAVKRCLSARYESKLFQDAEGYKEANQLAHKLAEHVRARSIKLKLFLYAPFLYRLFRIMNDPTMRVYEKNVKRQLRKGECMSR